MIHSYCYKAGKYVNVDFTWSSFCFTFYRKHFTESCTIFEGLYPHSFTYIKLTFDTPTSEVRMVILLVLFVLENGHVQIWTGYSYAV
jgi:hypothetical protein